MNATTTLNPRHSGLFDTDSARAAQALSAQVRKENTRKRRELMSLVKETDFAKLLTEQLNVNLTNEQKAAIKSEVMTKLMVGLTLEQQRHKNKLVEMCVKQELDEGLTDFSLTRRSELQATQVESLGELPDDIDQVVRL
ncbi:hypothetical protein CGJ43_00050 [Vibrio parahaemolyticus]|uniref:hypothetical protein n=1 Tax=Vibrio TaxID=662 RepID=UPI00112484E0|nr:hypothetical protein [Vibrio parahaemolyticus]MBE4278853.1 hypothetical protein [Vibrio parahaemolyticus]TOE43876.1 hypothetical protein CGJ43_00050 [Vibrio parahaemolyticus]HAS6346757.1 hypothetical protein [Vibrio vulnificus]HDY7968050.1 hypothetical protein [Vibrio vulnificus]